MSRRVAVVLEDNALVAEVCGANDANLKLLEDLLGCPVLSRGNEVSLHCDDESTRILFSNIFSELEAIARTGQTPSPDLVRSLYESLTGDRRLQVDLIRHKHIAIPGGFGVVYPKGAAQAEFIRGIENHDLSFCIGPAGTGKTFLAVAHALSEVLTRKRRKLVLTRPVVEAGENLGFLPGDLSQKISPYLRPLYDAMDAVVPREVVQRMEESRMIEVAPLAYMRGRSLRDCYVILDEAQNTTREQMKMFLTRMGEGTRAVVTGDITQVDLPSRTPSGLTHALSILARIDDIHVSTFHATDVVRSALVRKIVAAYEAET
ncbi:MAG: PhoH family protein [Spirochaetaceae bacterium]